MLKDKEKLQQLKNELETLRSSYDRYCKVNTEIYSLEFKIKQREDSDRLFILSFKTLFTECEYPSMGTPGCDGGAVFDSEEEARDLIKQLRTNSTYSKAYRLVWSGPGEYRVIPDYDYDHDGDIIYSATFIKMQEQGEV